MHLIPCREHHREEKGKGDWATDFASDEVMTLSEDRASIHQLVPGVS
jgi:hypothetical protein